MLRLVQDDDVVDEAMEMPNESVEENLEPAPDGELRDGEVEEVDDATAATVATDVDLPLLEALLMGTHHPLTAGRLAELMDLPGTKLVRAAIRKLNEEYEQTGRSFRIEQIAGGYQILSLPKFGEALQRLHQKEIDAKLTKAALETLAIIAYKQPILRADIEPKSRVGRSSTERPSGFWSCLD